MNYMCREKKKYLFIYFDTSYFPYSLSQCLRESDFNLSRSMTGVRGLMLIWRRIRSFATYFIRKLISKPTHLNYENKYFFTWGGISANGRHVSRY